MLWQVLKKAGIKIRPILDWQHLARRVQVTKQTAKGLRALTNAEYRVCPMITKTLERLHWKLWHGQVSAAKQLMARVERLLKPFDVGRTRAQTATPARHCTPP